MQITGTAVILCKYGTKYWKQETNYSLRYWLLISGSLLIQLIIHGKACRYWSDNKLPIILAMLNIWYNWKKKTFTCWHLCKRYIPNFPPITWSKVVDPLTYELIHVRIYHAQTRIKRWIAMFREYQYVKSVWCPMNVPWQGACWSRSERTARNGVTWPVPQVSQPAGRPQSASSVTATTVRLVRGTGEVKPAISREIRKVFQFVQSVRLNSWIWMAHNIILEYLQIYSLVLCRLKTNGTTASRGGDRRPDQPVKPRARWGCEIYHWEGRVSLKSKGDRIFWLWISRVFIDGNDFSSRCPMC